MSDTLKTIDGAQERETHFALLLDDEIFAAVLETAREEHVTPFNLCIRLLRDGLSIRKAVREQATKDNGLTS